jgi:hypothetical protein
MGVMASTNHYCFYCKHCGSLIKLPADRLGCLFSSPINRDPEIDSRSIAAVCGSCKHVGSYSLFPDSPDYDPRNTPIFNEPLGDTARVCWLKCEDKDCQLRLPLFVTWYGTISKEDGLKMAQEWIWTDLKCVAGHSIPKPAWAFPKGSSAESM